MEFYEHTQILQAAILSNPVIMDQIVDHMPPESIAGIVLSMAVEHSAFIQLHWEKISKDALKKLQAEKLQQL